MVFHVTSEIKVKDSLDSKLCEEKKSEETLPNMFSCLEKKV